MIADESVLDESQSAGSKINPDNSHSRESDLEEVIKFSPPLYKQRYERVFDILQTENVTRVADFGCSDCRALCVLRKLETLELLMGIDIDRQILEGKIHQLEPLITDYLHRRSRPLKIQIFHGDILQPNEQLAGIDAVSMIEVIEHLHFPDLERLPSVLFDTIQPRIVVITTPNADFNVLFPNLVGFRHPDHKFEWTREQFTEWCNKVTSKYSYGVEFDGIGEAPLAYRHLGCCSQVAIFRRDDSSSVHPTDLNSSPPYELIGEVLYPAEIKNTTIEEDILHEAVYYINFLSRSSSFDDDKDAPDDYESKRISLERIQSFSRHAFLVNDYTEKLREVLQNAGYGFSPDGNSVICPDNCRDDFFDDLVDDDDVDDDDGDDRNEDSSHVTLTGDSSTAQQSSPSEEVWG